MRIEIREAAIEDIPSVALVLAESWRSAYRGLVPDAYLDALTPGAQQQRMLAQWAAGRRFPTYLLIADGSPAGMLTCSAARDEDCPNDWGEIIACYLRPAYWGQGLGALLLRHGEEALRSFGFSAAYLWVLRDNARARKAYRRAGFAADGREKQIKIGGASLWEVRYQKEI